MAFLEFELMTYIVLLLWIKIIVTLLTVVLPVAVLSKNRLAALFGFGDAQDGFYRIYGVAILALLFGYYTGIDLANNGVFPEKILWMGIVSNLGATLVLLFGKFSKRNWPAIAFFGSIAFALIFMLLSPDLAMRTL